MQEEHLHDMRSCMLHWLGLVYNSINVYSRLRQPAESARCFASCHGSLWD